MTTNTKSPVDRAPRAFDRAIEGARPALQRHARQLTKDHAAADDLVQDTLARAWRARRRFESGTNINAWLFRIARNAFLAGLRRTRRQVSWDPVRHHSLLVQAPPQEEILYSRDLDVALSRLPETQRATFLLVAQEGMSIAAAAVELGVPLGTARSRIWRARASIMAFMGEEPSSIKVATRSEVLTLPVSSPALPVSDVVVPAQRHGPSIYQRWKASGATIIG